MKPIVSCLVIFLGLSVALIYGESRQWGRRVAGDRQLDHAVLVNNSLPVLQKSSIYRHLPALGAYRPPNNTAIETGIAKLEFAPPRPCGFAWINRHRNWTRFMARNAPPGAEAQSHTKLNQLP